MHNHFVGKMPIFRRMFFTKWFSTRNKMSAFSDSNLSISEDVLFALHCKRPPCRLQVGSIMKSVMDDLSPNEWDVLYEERKINEDGVYKVVLCSKKHNIILSLSGLNGSIGNCHLLYDDYIKCADIVNVLNKHISIVKEEKNKVSLILQNGNDLYTEKFEVKNEDFNIPLHYGFDFVPIYNTLLSNLNEFNTGGIALLHGIPGSGKTHLIKNIIANIKKDVLILPPYMTEQLSSPSIIPFLLRFKDSVLVIEDAERVIMDRNNGGSISGISNLLNISDGILGDCLNLKIIATFNSDKSKIDSALLRKGRLIVEHKFDKLSVECSQKLATHLGKDIIVNSPMTLAEIYNTEKHFIVTESRPSIGFNKN
jgi:hypothetical protein